MAPVILTVLELGLLTLLSFLAYRRRRDRSWALLAAVSISGLREAAPKTA